jgi:nucleoside-diphosphate-sugar epimerase
MKEAFRKRVLVTGGAGFLGSHLCERLLARCRPTIPRVASPTSRRLRSLLDWQTKARKNERAQKSNIDMRSPIAALFTGRYGSAAPMIALGKPSRLRGDSGAKRQLRSMNLSTDE